MGEQLHILLNTGNFLYISVNDFLRVRMFGLNPKLARWANKLLKLLAQQENLLVQTTGMDGTFFKLCQEKKIRCQHMNTLKQLPSVCC